MVERNMCNAVMGGISRDRQLRRQRVRLLRCYGHKCNVVAFALGQRDYQL
jgi:hypothetical protein